MAQSGSQVKKYVDAWAEMRDVLQGLRKKSLKKPNYPEAIVKLTRLALRMADENQPYEAAMAQIQIANLYNIVEQPHDERNAYLTSAGLMMKAYKAYMNTGTRIACHYPGEIAQCMRKAYNIALKVMKAKGYAGSTCVQATKYMIECEDYPSAIGFARTGLELLTNTFCIQCMVYQDMATAYFRLYQWDQLLLMVDEFWMLAMKLKTKKGDFGSVNRVLKDIEALTMFCLLKSRITPTGRHRVLLNLYETYADPPQRRKKSKQFAFAPNLRKPSRRSSKCQDSLQQMNVEADKEAEGTEEDTRDEDTKTPTPEDEQYGQTPLANEYMESALTSLSVEKVEPSFSGSWVPSVLEKEYRTHSSSTTSAQTSDDYDDSKEDPEDIEEEDFATRIVRKLREMNILLTGPVMPEPVLQPTSKQDEPHDLTVPLDITTPSPNKTKNQPCRARDSALSRKEYAAFRQLFLLLKARNADEAYWHVVNMNESDERPLGFMEPLAKEICRDLISEAHHIPPEIQIVGAPYERSPYVVPRVAFRIQQ